MIATASIEDEAIQRAIVGGASLGRDLDVSSRETGTQAMATYFRLAQPAVVGGWWRGGGLNTME